ncbi:hypothetical protein ACS0TY_015312 [Phlomoides rotata]
MMQIFVRKLKGNTTTLNVESWERVCNIKRKLKENEGVRSDLHLGLIYNGNLLGDEHTLAHYNILQKSTLQLFLSQHTFAKTWDMYVETWSEKIFSIKVKSVDRIDDVKAKIQEKKGIPPHNQLLFFQDKWLEDGSRTLADYQILNYYSLQLAIQFQQGPQSAPTQPQVAPPQSKRARPATRGDGEATATLSDLMPEIRSDPPPSVLTELEDLKQEMSTARSKEKELEATISGLTQKNHVFSAQCASYESQIVALKAENKKTEEELTVARNKQKELEVTISGLTQKNKSPSVQCVVYRSQIVGLKAENKKTEKELTVARNKQKELEVTISGLTQKNKPPCVQCVVYRSQIVGLKAENKKTEKEPTVARNKQKELEVTISGLTQKNKPPCVQCVVYRSQIVVLKAENKKTEKEPTVACNKQKELEVTISGLTQKNESSSSQCASYESQIVGLKAENKKTEEELTVARNKQKELEFTIFGLTHKNKVFSSQCASYESQVVALEVENKKTKEELMNADKKYYAGARAAGYAEGLMEGKSKWLKSVEFLHHLTDASMRYFNHGFDSCQKQAELQGFLGQLNKDSALEDGSLVTNHNKWPL